MAAGRLRPISRGVILHILLTNDDGLMAPGLLAAYAALKGRGHKVTACAPDCQRSAASQSVTLRSPIKVAPWEMPDKALGFAVYGTPADCARLGFTVLAKEPVDLVVSGINDDYNLGFDINYSGTVAAAIEAAAAGYPALAVSTQRADEIDWKTATHILVAVVDNLSSWSIPQGVAVNLNIPAELTTSRNEWFWTRPHPAPADDYYESEPHPDGSVLYQRLRGANLEQAPGDEDTDLIHAGQGHITLSPIMPHGFHTATLGRLAASMESNG
ncbi:5'/3'-nucleotidase SurE [Deltaproteobacteria bacterium Smac51]|nr:5'/3'-nucleotidase SurE [Deltaproteobacteria bacterium Smac51]